MTKNERCTTNTEQLGTTVHNFSRTMVVNTDAALLLEEQSPKLSKSSSSQG